MCVCVCVCVCVNATFSVRPTLSVPGCVHKFVLYVSIYVPSVLYSRIQHNIVKQLSFN